MMELSAATFVTIFAIIGLLALIVSVITEVTKGVVLLSKIPANLQVIILSLTLTIVTYFAYISYSGKTVIWYYVVATVVAGFIVAYVVLFGWNKFLNQYKRFRNIPPVDITTDTNSVIPTDKSVTSNDNKVELANVTTIVDSSAAADSTVDISTTTR